MEAELVALAASGASVLVHQMVTDGWAHARDRLVSLFTRGDATPEEEEAVAGELETARGELSSARDSGDDELARDVEAEWRTRLRRRLAADPSAAARLRSVLAELEESGPARRTGDVHNSVGGNARVGGPVIQAGDVGSLHIGGQGQAVSDA
ncbi:hypothetical protein ACPXCE_13090 [Streptomyces sp. DT24]|uniref:hypothetical protein n=1 Tax=unclassified Streptomyces TaxID=2593676 RepID=UPI003CF74BDE